MVDPLAGAGRILCQTIDLGEGGLDKANDFLSVRLQSAKEHQLHEGHFDLKRSVNLPSAALRQDEPFLNKPFLNFSDSASLRGEQEENSYAPDHARVYAYRSVRPNRNRD
jgi:hypothetical protein